MQLAVLDTDGYAVCPDCGTRVKCGSAGLANLEKRHRPSDACKNAQQKRDKEQKKKDTSLFNYFKGPKVPVVPLTIIRSELIQSRRLTPLQVIDTSAAVPDPQTESLALSENVPVPIFENILEEFRHYLDNLPESIPEATYDDKLVDALAGHPEIHTNPTLQGDELWEVGLNVFLKSVLGWGTDGDVGNLIKGKKGLEHLFDFVKYFIVKRGVSEGLFQGKLAHLFEGRSTYISYCVQRLHSHLSRWKIATHCLSFRSA